ncbi:hypothetical protein RYH80_10290 [Halobaculum sp. MBLA0147]
MTQSHTDGGAEVMAAVDESTSEFVIADLGREDAWLSIRAGEARPLEEWC